MTTNTNPSRTTARFAADTTALTANVWIVRDRNDGLVIASATGRAEARRIAAVLNSHAELIAEPQPRLTVVPDAKPAEAPARTSHSDCAHASTKMARAICRRDRAKADTNA